MDELNPLSNWTVLIINICFCIWSGDETDEKQSKKQPSVEVNTNFIAVK